MNPALVEVWRGRLVESIHRGAVAVADADGRLVLSIGEVDKPVFPRSAVKALQALPLIETGAADALGITDREIALAASSHTGSVAHVEVVRAVLARAGIDGAMLECGAHQPLGQRAARDLIAAGVRPGPLHNNCSGKHAGMLATALFMGEPLQGYTQPRHPVQVRVRAGIEALSGMVLGADFEGVDGCSVPNWAMPLPALARALAGFVAGAGPVGGGAAGRGDREASRRIVQACWAFPEMVAGPGRLDTEVMRGLAGEVFLKTGAEGVYCAGLPRLGLGVALKIDDGAKRAAEVVVMQVIAGLLPAASALAPKEEIRNWRGIVTGRIVPSPALRKEIAQALRTAS